MSRPPPRSETKSLIIRSWSPVKNDASIDPSNDGAIVEELGAGHREPTHQLERVGHAQSEVFLVRGTQQRHELQLLVTAHGAASELQFRARLTFHIQHALLPVAHW